MTNPTQQHPRLPPPIGGPVRIQRRRTKGWRMPPNIIYVGRPGRFGNPFDWMIFGRENAVDFYRRWLLDDLTPAERASTGIDLPTPDVAAGMRTTILRRMPELKGKNLACWCVRDQPYHADMLMELANA